MKPDQVEVIEDFYEKHQKSLFTYALSLTRCQQQAEDMIHTVFYRIIKSKKVPQNLKSYVYRGIRNASIDLKRAQPSLIDSESLFDLPDSGNTAEQFKLQLQIEQLFETLSDDERETIVLNVYGSFTFEEIASIRSVSKNTAYSWYRRGITKLRTALEEEPSWNPLKTY